MKTLINYKDIFIFLNLNGLILEYFETREKFIPAFNFKELSNSLYNNYKKRLK